MVIDSQKKKKKVMVIDTKLLINLHQSWHVIQLFIEAKKELFLNLCVKS